MNWIDQARIQADESRKPAQKTDIFIRLLKTHLFEVAYRAQLLLLAVL